MSADFYYDWLTRKFSIMYNPKVFYYGSEDDSEEVQKAHLRRAMSPEHVIRYSVGDPPLHTPDLLA